MQSFQQMFVGNFGHKLRQKCCQNVRNLSYFQAVLPSKFGQKLEIREVSKKLKPKMSQALVRVHSAGLNHADWLMTGGLHHVKPEIPFVPGA